MSDEDAERWLAAENADQRKMAAQREAYVRNAAIIEQLLAEEREREANVRCCWQNELIAKSSGIIIHGPPPTQDEIDAELASLGFVTLEDERGSRSRPLGSLA